ncbi:serine hydrolase [Arthrobacter sp. NPDC058130]|uniref:serine hydrolase n=1 Tax=Arthrobacter sp. NPDC058130 TaxID=3346353 RepID=UPI0036EB6CC9
MEQHTPRQRRFGSRRGAGRSPRRIAARPRVLMGAVCAAVLAVALAAGFFSAAGARTLTAAGGLSAASPAAGGAPAAPGVEASADASAEVSAPASDKAAGTADAALDARIQAILDANSQYQIGVALMDVSSGADPAEVHEYGVREDFVAASTAKVLAAAAYYHLVETGAASVDDPLGAYTARFQLREMIQQSDNDSWSLVMDAVGHSELTDYAASLGVDYDPETNRLTPAAMARILAGVYSGTLLDAADTAELLSYMQDTNYETLIPAAVPDGITVFHKYGLLNDELHDAGILTRDGTACALVIYTKGQDLSDVPERTEVIHQLTQAVAGALF